MEKSSLLHIALGNYNIEMLELLLTINIDLSSRDMNGDTALSKAIRNNNEKAIKLLKNHNQDPNNEINPYYNIIQYATKITGTCSIGNRIESSFCKKTDAFYTSSSTFLINTPDEIESIKKNHI